MLYICGECGFECELVEKDMGSFLDLAYGIPKRFSYIIDVTSCCNSEEWEEVEEVYDEEFEDSQEKNVRIIK